MFKTPIKSCDLPVLFADVTHRMLENDNESIDSLLIESSDHLAEIIDAFKRECLDYVKGS